MLHAVLTPERENTLRSALATSMLGLTARDIDALNLDEDAWDRVLKSSPTTASCGKNAA